MSQFAAVCFLPFYSNVEKNFQILIFLVEFKVGFCMSDISICDLNIIAGTIRKSRLTRYLKLKKKILNGW